MVFNELNKADWEQIAKYLSGEMDLNEIEFFEKRINFSEENKAFVNQVKKEWENMKNFKKKEDTFDTNKAWGNLYTKFEQDGLIETKESAHVINLKQIIKIAAIFILGVAFSSLVYYMVSDTKQANILIADTYNTKGIKEVKLSDGSVVYLNADSKLYYPKKFSTDTRTVEFEGDAFFDIAKNPSKPFIIKANKAEIKVLGTSFNIKTNIDKDEVEVLVATGKVMLSKSNIESKAIFIEPGYMGKLQKDKLSKQINSDVNYMAWKTKFFDFENGIKLGKAIEVLNRAYHVNIQFTDVSISEKELHTTFNNVPFDTILQIICDATNLKYKREESGINLTRQ